MIELNKFKVITMVFILIFVFCVAAMYSNTKDVAADRTSEENSMSSNQLDSQISYDENRINRNSSKYKDLNDRVIYLEQLYNKLSETQKNMENESSKLNCNIQGVMSGDILVPLSQSESLSEARNSGKDIVMLCSFK